MDKTAEEPLFAKTSTGGEDSFYDTIETSSPEYDNAVNSSQVAPQDPEEKARQEEEWKSELAKLEEEINTLRTVLSAKVGQASVLKHRLGITPMTEFKTDVKHTFQGIKESEAYKKTNEHWSKLNAKITGSPAVQKTNEKIHQLTETIQTSDAYQKTGTAFKSFGAFASKKFGDMRNSNTFKSFEEKVGGAYTNVKSKVRGSKSENNFGDVLNSPTEEGIPENTVEKDSLSADTDSKPL